MSGNQGHAYPPGQGPPHPSQSAYPPPMPGGFVPPPGGQPGYGPPPGQPGYGAPPPGQPGYGVPPPGQPGYGAPPPGQFGYGAPPGYGGVPGYGMPPPAYGGPPPPGVGVPPGMGYPGGAPYQGGGAPGYPHQPGFKQSGNESDDSQPGDPGLRSKGGSKRIKCTFVNHSDTKVILCKIDERGKCHKVAKMKDGKKEVIETSEGDVFVARGKGRKKKKRHIVINNNALYAVTAEHDGDDKVHAEILRGPDCLKDLSSEKKNDVEVKVKFINRSKKTAQLVWMNHKGKREKMKTLAPGKCYTTKAHECNFWIAHDIQNEDEGLYMNYSYFYSPWKTRKHKERVLITQDRPWGDSSGSSSSDSD